MNTNIPTFFIPDYPSVERAKQDFDNIIEASRKSGEMPSAKKIFRLRFRHDGELFTCEVGKAHPYNPQGGANLVKFILQKGSPRLYDVYANRYNFVVGHDDVFEVTEFSE